MSEREPPDDESASSEGESASSEGESASSAAAESATSTADSEPTPNERQRELIESTEGTYLVDAGAGTGKTFAIARRYARIVDQPDVEPEDVLLVTFTRSAATEMRERIVDRASYSLGELADAPIQTFHAYCSDLLREHGHRAPTHLGLDRRITDSTRVLEDEIVAEARFREFFDRFRETHPEHADLYRVLDDGTELLAVVEELAAKGVVPTTDGWYGDGEAVLEGDFDAFEDCFEVVNRPRNGGSKQSKLRENLARYGKDRTYLPDAPSRGELRGDGTKRVPPATARRAFEADREALQALVHDVYVEYLDFALSRNYLTFGFLQLLASVLLREDHRAREAVAFEYVLVDEFQDTSEVQFELALLLCGTENLCVVGDWKQSIYAFQYADVDNILAFESRLEAFAAELNDDQQRVPFDAPDVTRIELEENYRSTQRILDLSEDALVAPATSYEAVDEAVLEDVVSLSANAPFEDSVVEGFAHPDECEAVLTAVQEIVGNDDYAVADDGEPRPPTYGDVAVLTRTRDFGRELLATAETYDVPTAYDGGVELFRTDQAKLLLAWLRILDSGADRGWAVVLEEAGYTLAEIRQVLETGAYPSTMVAFRDELAALDAIGAVARRVFDRYGFTDAYAAVLLDTVQSMHDGSTLARGDLLRLLERGIETGSTHEVTTSAGVDSLTVQTIHAAKGLEYPIVVLANMNDGAFPPRGGGAGVVHYEEPIGLRQRKRYAEVQDYPHVYDDWTYDVLRHCVPDAYDEERRLLYVAITRAKHHVVFAAGDEPNAFFEDLPFEERSIEPAVEQVDRTETTQTQLPFSIVPPDGPTGYTPHSLLDDSVFESEEAAGGASEELDRDATTDDGQDSPTFRGLEFGIRVHDFAEAYALGEDVTPSTGDPPDERTVAAFLDGLEGDLHVEEKAVLPLDVDGERVTITGFVDLVHVTPDSVEVVDYKTDRTRRAESEYRTQLSVYYHVLREWFPDRDVSASIFYTGTGERQVIEPRSIEELVELVREVE